MADQKLTLKQYQAIREIIFSLNNGLDFDIMSWNINYLKRKIKVTYRELKFDGEGISSFKTWNLHIPFLVLEDPARITSYIKWLQAKYKLEELMNEDIYKDQIGKMETALKKLRTLESDGYISVYISTLELNLATKKELYKRHITELTKLEKIVNEKSWNMVSLSQTSLDIAIKFLDKPKEASK